MSTIDNGCTSAGSGDEPTRRIATERVKNAIHGNTAVVGNEGEIRLPDADRRRWGMEPGTKLTVHETAQGLVLRPQEGVLRKVYVEPTLACNLACRTCVRQAWDEPLGSMDMDTYGRLIAALREVPSLDTMSFWGFGEPLMHPDILEMLGLAKTLGIRTELITNALLLDAEMAKGLVATGLDTLVVSVDGIAADTYAEIRAGGTLAQVRANARHLLEARRAAGHGKPEVGIEFVAMRRNVDQLPGLAGLAQELEASFVLVTNVLPYTEELKDEILYGLWAGRAYPAKRTPWMPEILLPRLDLRHGTLEPAALLVSKTGYAAPPAHDGQNPSGYCRFVTEGSIAVAWDGAISPCVPLMHSYRCYVMRRPKQILRYAVGNIRLDDLLALWSAPEFVSFRDRVHRFDFAPCTECGGCNLSETNEQDCFGNTFPVCGDCLWARGVIRCP